jgi:hypothetical protein
MTGFPVLLALESTTEVAVLKMALEILGESSDMLTDDDQHIALARLERAVTGPGSLALEIPLEVSVLHLALDDLSERSDLPDTEAEEIALYALFSRAEQLLAATGAPSLVFIP